MRPILTISTCNVLPNDHDDDDDLDNDEEEEDAYLNLLPTGAHDLKRKKKNTNKSHGKLDWRRDIPLSLSQLLH